MSDIKSLFPRLPDSAFTDKAELQRRIRQLERELDMKGEWPR